MRGRLGAEKVQPVTPRGQGAHRVLVQGRRDAAAFGAVAADYSAKCDRRAKRRNRSGFAPWRGACFCLVVFRAIVRIAITWSVRVGKSPCPKQTKFPSLFSNLILSLQQYWADQGCVILRPYDMEMGAGTFHPATVLRALGPELWDAAYVQPSRRPTDGRYGENFVAFSIIIGSGDFEAVPDNIQRLISTACKCWASIRPCTISVTVEDDWESRRWARGGWAGKCGAMAEVSQFPIFNSGRH